MAQQKISILLVEDEENLQEALKLNLELEGYEMLKAFSGVHTHEHREVVPLFANNQDILELSRMVVSQLKSQENPHGFLIEGHGLYTWGSNLNEAVRHLEAFEFLLECETLAILGRQS